MSFVFFSSLGIFSLQHAKGPNAICTPPNNKAQQQEQIIPAKYRHCYGLPFLFFFFFTLSKVHLMYIPYFGKIFEKFML